MTLDGEHGDDLERGEYTRLHGVRTLWLLERAWALWCTLDCMVKGHYGYWREPGHCGVH